MRTRTSTTTRSSPPAAFSSHPQHGFNSAEDTAVAYPIAFLIFVALSAACWFVSVSLFKSTLDDTSVTASPDYTTTGALAVVVVAATCFAPFPGGYVAGLVVWAVAAFAGLGLTAGRAMLLFAYLAASSFVERLVVLGVMDMMGN